MLNSQAFTQFMTDLAHCMGFEWDLGDIDGNGGRLLGPGGARVYIKPSTWEYDPTNSGRLEISGTYPYRDGTSFVAPNNKARNITCAISKAPAQVTHDIRRRFLPKYLAAHQEACQAERAYLERKAKHHAQLEEIAKVIGDHSPGPEAERVDIHNSPHPLLGGHVETYQDRMHLDIRGIPWDLGMQILKLLVT